MTTTPTVPPITSRRILIVDDEPSVAQTLRLILKKDGHEVEIAEDGARGLVLFDASPFDLVITDYRMANMDGLKLAREIRARRPSQPIILVTAFLEALEKSKRTLADVNTLLGKPFSVEQLRSAVGEIFPPA